MTPNRIIDHIFHEDELRNVDQQALERLVEQYPYFAAARVLLAQKQFAYTPDFQTPVFKAAQLYTSTPQYLYQMATANAPETSAPVEQRADAWQAGEIAVEDAVHEQDQAIIDNIEAAADQTPAPFSDTLEAEVDAEEEVLLEELEPASAVAIAENGLAASGFSENGHDLKETALPAETFALPGSDNDNTVEAISPEDQAILDELEAEDRAAAESRETITTAAEAAIAIPPTEVDEVVAVDYEAEEEKAAFDAARNGEVPDEIIAVDYETEEEKAAFDAARNLEVPDDVVAVDYEAEEEKVAFDAARNLEVPDDVIAVDYEALQTGPTEYEPEVEEEEIEVPTGQEPEGHGLAIPPAPEAPSPTNPQKQPLLQPPPRKRRLSASTPWMRPQRKPN